MVHFNSSLENIDALSTLSTIGGSIQIISNFSLQSLPDWNLLEKMGMINIEGNFVLGKLPKFSSLLEIRGEIKIANNPLISSINFPLLSKITAPIISSNVSKINVSENNQLQEILFPSLIELNGGFAVESIIINNNPILESINLGNMVNFDGAVSLSLNSSLSQFLLSQEITSITSLNVTDNESLTSLNVGGLENIDLALNIQNNPIESINFNSLRDIGTNLIVTNTSLSTLSFPSLSTVFGNVIITDHNFLTNINLPSLFSLEMLTIHRNQLLSVCSINQLEINLRNLGWDGVLSIIDNFNEMCP